MGVDSFTSVHLGERDIYIHKCDFSSVGDDRGGGCMVITYWPVDGCPPPGAPGAVQCLGAMAPSTLGTDPRVPGAAMPKPKPRDHFTLKRPSPQKVTQDPAQVAHFVWEKPRGTDHPHSKNLPI